MPDQLVRKLKLYLVGFEYNSDYRKNFLKYRKQNRFIIKDKDYLNSNIPITSNQNKEFINQSNFIIYCVNLTNINNKDYLREVYQNAHNYPGKNIIFIPRENYTLDEIKYIDAYLNLNSFKGFIYTAFKTTELVNLLFKLRFDDSGWSTHTEEGTKFYFHSDDSSWEYV